MRMFLIYPFLLIAVTRTSAQDQVIPLDSVQMDLASEDWRYFPEDDTVVGEKFMQLASFRHFYESVYITQRKYETAVYQSLGRVIGSGDSVLSHVLNTSWGQHRAYAKKVNNDFYDEGGIRSSLESRAGGFQDPIESGSIDRLFGPSQYDSRVEVRTLNPFIDWQFKVWTASQSVAMVVDRTKLVEISEDYYELDISQTLQNAFFLCDAEPFGDQPTVGVGTAFLVGSDSFCTARHVFDMAPEKYAVVFGFETISKHGVYKSVLHKNNVYFVEGFVSGGVDEELDIAVFKVDRPTDLVPLKWSSTVSLKQGTPVYTIGNPLGLPTKVAVNASILDNSDYHYLFTSVDAYRGNSGSPVFRLDTHEVIGVLVAGEPEFQVEGNCNISKTCQSEDCIGERIVRTESIIQILSR